MHVTDSAPPTIVRRRNMNDDEVKLEAQSRVTIFCEVLIAIAILVIAGGLFMFLLGEMLSWIR
jgi:hypothetical protein